MRIIKYIITATLISLSSNAMDSALPQGSGMQKFEGGFKFTDFVSRQDILKIIDEIVIPKDGEAAKRGIERLSKLSKETLDAVDPHKLYNDNKFFAKAIKPLMRNSPEYAGKLFNALLLSGTSLPKHTVEFLWHEYVPVVKKYDFLSGSSSEDEESEESEDSRYYAAVFFIENSRHLNTDFISNSSNQRYFEDMLLVNSNKLLKDVKLINTNILCNSLIRTNLKVSFIKQILANIKPEDKTTYINNIFSHQGWLGNAGLIIELLSKTKNLNLKINYAEAISNFVFKNMLKTLISDAKNETSLSNFYTILSEIKYKKNSTSETLKLMQIRVLSTLAQFITRDDIPLDDRINIFVKTSKHILFTGRLYANSCAYYNYLKFAISNLNNIKVLNEVKENLACFDEFEKKLLTLEQVNELEKILDISNEQVRRDFEDKDISLFYNSIKKMVYINYLKLNNQQETTQKTTEKLNFIIADLYKNYLKSFFNYTFSDLPGKALGQRGNDAQYIQLEDVRKAVIYNHDGYTADENGQRDIELPPQKDDGSIIIGNPLVLERGTYIKDTSDLTGARVIKVEKDIPIGYNIHLPKGDIQGVFVWVYGGYYKQERKEKFLTPNCIFLFMKYLLKQKIAVVSLNLVDLLKLEFEVSGHCPLPAQAIMPLKIHAELHASINKFFDTLRTAPEKIAPNLEIQKTTKIYLFGGSFGGTNAIRHAELYPNTFDGYISHDGGLSSALRYQEYQEYQNTSVKEIIERTRICDCISPQDENLKFEKLQGKRKDAVDSKICNIRNPLLLLHNFDDNRVSIKELLDFYREAVNCNKNDLIQLLITERGPVIPIDDKIDLKNQFFRSSAKGHYFPREDEAFNVYTETIASFILKGPSIFPAKNKWMAHQYEIYANKDYKAARLEERFISEAYRLYKTLEYPGQENFEFEDFWNQCSDLYRVLLYVESFKSRFYERDNYEYYEESAITDEIEFLRNSELTDVVFENAIRHQLSNFLDYLREKHGFQLPDGMDLNVFARNKKLQAQYRDLLFSNKKYISNDRFNLDIISSLVVGNFNSEEIKDIVASRIEQLTEDENISHEKLTSDEESAMENLIFALQHDKILHKKCLDEQSAEEVLNNFAAEGISLPIIKDLGTSKSPSAFRLELLSVLTEIPGLKLTGAHAALEHYIKVRNEIDFDQSIVNKALALSKLQKNPQCNIEEIRSLLNSGVRKSGAGSLDQWPDFGRITAMLDREARFKYCQKTI